MVSKGHSCFQIAAATAQNSPLGNGGSLHRRIVSGQFVDHGHHALMRLDLYRHVNGYDQSLSHNEDAELDQRLLAAGGRIWLEPGLAITYYPRRDPVALWRQYRRYGAGRFATMVRHRHRPKLRQLLPLAVPLAVGLAILAVPLLALAIHGNTRWGLWLSVALALPMMMWATICLIYGLVLGIQQRQPCSCASGVAAMITHLAWGIGFMQQFARFRGRPKADPRAVATQSLL
jgi:succinoglycan biosynthesis protein ExoA